MEYKMYCDSIEEIYGSSKSGDLPVNVNHIWKEISSQSKQPGAWPYSIKKKTQIAEFSVVTPEQTKIIKPVELANLSKIP